jgi:UDPglucose 6-dehydrogenase
VAVDRLQQDGAVVRVYDPAAIPEASAVRPDFTYCDEPYEALAGADALLILTEWPCFKELDYSRVRAIMASPIIVDGRNLLDPASLATLGFAYTGVGRP